MLAPRASPRDRGAGARGEVEGVPHYTDALGGPASIVNRRLKR
jgi:hypothetical protein